ncbi:DNA polymerase III, chi subunit [Nitrosomonas ureae]|uniref:DNA polymerase III, chi subunit n=1 Tax=Nitrosomonas ureae TaxID=44577 RepID=A0A285BWB8_9PROT|nr:DNA polymerase III subunit chi [Nitrosomonas ureae]SNX59532.1 DNA polymerase III, chi subunit [Nitrosomonas ureae]
MTLFSYKSNALIAMTQILFYSGSNNKLQTTCRLCAKAIQQHMRVLIYVPASKLLDQLDQLLWTFSSTSFIPHCNILDDAKLVSATPVILSGQIQVNSPFDVLINLHDQSPHLFDQFDRLIEIAGTSHEDKLAARERYRFYKNAGYEIQHYHLNDQSEPH